MNIQKFTQKSMQAIQDLFVAHAQAAIDSLK